MDDELNDAVDGTTVEVCVFEDEGGFDEVDFIDNVDDDACLLNVETLDRVDVPSCRGTLAILSDIQKKKTIKYFHKFPIDLPLLQNNEDFKNKKKL